MCVNSSISSFSFFPSPRWKCRCCPTVQLVCLGRHNEGCLRNGERHSNEPWSSVGGESKKRLPNSTVGSFLFHVSLLGLLQQVNILVQAFASRVEGWEVVLLSFFPLQVPLLAPVECAYYMRAYMGCVTPYKSKLARLTLAHSPSSTNSLSVTSRYPLPATREKLLLDFLFSSTPTDTSVISCKRHFKYICTYIYTL